MTAFDRCRELGIALKDYAIGKHGAVCPKCSHLRKPFHQRTQCLTVTIDSEMTLYYCHHCGWKGGARNERRRHSYTARDPAPSRSQPPCNDRALAELAIELDKVPDFVMGQWPDGESGRTSQWRKPAPLPLQRRDDDAAARIRHALARWGEAKPIDGTVAATHLAKRGIDLGQLPRDLDAALRWHGACPWEAGRHGCMIGLMTDAVTGEPKAVHRTAITPNGDKVGRKMLGPAAGCVIRLWPDDEVLDGLVIGEGIETVLAAATRIEHKGTLLQPAWACATAGLLERFPVLSGIEALTILVDKDESGRGEEAAAECAARWTATGREVTRLTPRKLGTDFNDLARKRA